MIKAAAKASLSTGVSVGDQYVQLAEACCLDVPVKPSV